MPAPANQIRPKVVIGLQGAQMPANAIRGIGRWASEFTLAMVQNYPEVVAALSMDPILPIPKLVNELSLDVPILLSDERPPVGTGERLVFHAVSVFEDLPLNRIWPVWAQHAAIPFVPTVHDLIPALYPDEYLQGALHHLRRARQALIQQSDAVLAVSQNTAFDVVNILSYDFSRTFVASGAVDSWFHPHPGGTAAAFRELPERYGLREGFILSIGNVEPRKNLRRLLAAYATLPADLRQSHQLVITCSQGSTDQLAELERLAAETGIADDTVITSFVDDDTMKRLYQSCTVMAFPSVYEGLGLPLIEATRCGALAICSDVGAMREAIPDSRARFDPMRVADIGKVLRQVLTDGALADELRRVEYARSLTFDWRSSAAHAVEAYTYVANRP